MRACVGLTPGHTDNGHFLKNCATRRMRVNKIFIYIYLSISYRKTGLLEHAPKVRPAAFITQKRELEARVTSVFEKSHHIVRGVEVC